MPTAHGPLRAEYVFKGRMWHFWVARKTGYHVHVAPRVIDNFGNSVRIKANRIRQFVQQNHD